MIRLVRLVAAVAVVTFVFANGAVLRAPARIDTHPDDAAASPGPAPSDAAPDEGPVPPGLDRSSSSWPHPTTPVIETRSALLSDAPQATTAAAPTEIRIPSLDIAAPIVGVGVDADGAMAIPPDAESVAWYRHGASPGESGSAVLAGHVDFNGRLGVFFDLRSAPLDSEIVVTYGDGSARRFLLRRVQQYPKTTLPAAELFSHTGEPRLVLITCGGQFDRSTRHYLDNIVAFAEPV